MTKTRTKNATLNIVIIVIMQLASFIYSIVIKNIYLTKFSLSAYGVVDLFSSFFQSLMYLELGFGTILIYNLFKPVAQNNIVEIRRQLSIFKTIYLTISLIIFTLSLITLPFLYRIFNVTYDDKVLVYLLYLLNIIQILVKYFFLNKNSIIGAGQYTYINNIIVIIVDFICFVGKIISVLVLENIYLFFAFVLIAPSIEIVISSIWVDKNYDVKGIKCASFKEIRSSGVLYQCHRYIYASIYALIFSSMDNMIISNILSTDAVAYTTNYVSIFSTAWSLIMTINSAIRGIMADYANSVDSNSDVLDVFNIVSTFNFFIVALACVGLYSLMDDFVGLWLGYSYVINKDIMTACLLIKMIDCLFEPLLSIFTIKGYIFKEKWPLIISALTNFILTIIFLKKFGLIGAYLATIIALIIKWIGKMYHTVTGVFNNNKANVIIRYSLYIIVIGIEMILISNISSSIINHVTSLYLFVIKFLLVAGITCIINFAFIILDRSTREYIKHTLLKK